MMQSDLAQLLRYCDMQGAALLNVQADCNNVTVAVTV